MTPILLITAKGRPFSKRVSAPRIFAAETIFMDFVIFDMFFVDPIRIKTGGEVSDVFIALKAR